MTESDQRGRIVLPMTSIADDPGGGGERSSPWEFYLTVIGEQAQIALRHLLALWEMEGDPPDLGVWTSGRIDSTVVWSHLQGAMFAGIVLARMLDPRVRGSEKTGNPARRAQYKARRAAADARATRLRELLDFPDPKDAAGTSPDRSAHPGSPLLSIREVRDAFEHFDERIDDVVAAGDVASVSDFGISLGGRFRDVDPSDDSPEGSAQLRHVTLRQFAPDLGVLSFGEHSIDLFAYETALHGLLSQLPDAHQRSVGPTPPKWSAYGSAQLLKWDAGQVEARRQEIARVRQQVRDAGEWLLRWNARPRTVNMVWTTPDDTAEPSEGEPGL